MQNKNEFIRIQVRVVVIAIYKGHGSSNSTSVKQQENRERTSPIRSICLYSSSASTR